MIDGILNIYKEPGYTSHDVVAKLRGILRQKKIGHTGTLDPEAQGVLPVCLGKATKVCEFLTDHDKTYRAVLRLGVETDTQDMTGRVLAERRVSCGEEELLSCIQSFVGRQQQLPPMYSALKVGGKKLCDLARQGIEVERKTRQIEITEILVEKVELPDVTMSVSCSRGTYIRTLCHDIGAALGCGGCMKSLVRTRVGNFCAEDGVTLTQVESLRDAGRLADILVPVDAVFSELPALTLTPGGDRPVKNGNAFRREQCRLSGGAPAGEALAESADSNAESAADGSIFGMKQTEGASYRVYGSDGSFLAVYRWNSGREQFVPVKMFLS